MPSKFSEAEVASKKLKACELRAEGANWVDVATAMAISRETLRRWRKQDEAFETACNDADEVCTDTLEDDLEISARLAKKDPRYIPALIFALKNKRPHKWRDVQAIEHSGALNLATMSEDEIRRRAALVQGD
jgi:predicted nucleotidyltransferase component of viral defense system